MEKLIKLLDLYRRENKTEELFGEPGTLVPLTGKDFIMLNRVMIISKEYGFIKWLVDNDKIDISNYEYKIGVARIGENNMDEWYDEYSDYEKTLMLLAIQDEPIQFLISILK